MQAKTNNMLRLLLILWLLPAMAFAQMFPSVDAWNLLEEDYTLPTDLQGSPRVIILAFEREHQEIVNPWLDALARMQETDFPEMNYYELPTVGRMSMLGRWWLDSMMRTGIKEEAQRRRTITMFLEDREATMAQIGIGDLTTIYTLVLNANGTVRGSIPGAADDQKLERLIALIKE